MRLLGFKPKSKSEHEDKPADRNNVLTVLVEDGASLATVVRASYPRRLEACTTNGRQIYASDYQQHAIASSRWIYWVASNLRLFYTAVEDLSELRGAIALEICEGGD